jgi:hypothetical protein
VTVSDVPLRECPFADGHRLLYCADIPSRRGLFQSACLDIRLRLVFLAATQNTSAANVPNVLRLLTHVFSTYFVVTNVLKVNKLSH